MNESIKNKETVCVDFEKHIQKIKDYFRSLLWKRIKGNFIVSTSETGEVNNIIPHETFSTIKNPLILGANKIIYTMDQDNRNPLTRR